MGQDLGFYDARALEDGRGEEEHLKSRKGQWSCLQAKLFPRIHWEELGYARLTRVAGGLDTL